MLGAECPHSVTDAAGCKGTHDDSVEGGHRLIFNNLSHPTIVFSSYLGVCLFITPSPRFSLFLTMLVLYHSDQSML